METEGSNGRFHDDDVETLRSALELVQQRTASIASNPARHARARDARSLSGDIARRIYQARRARARAFPDATDLFQEPAWDLLLDLYIARDERREVSVTSACIASNVPSTTALRWITALVHRDLIERIDDPHDRRRSLVQLSQMGLAAMERYLEMV